MKDFDLTKALNGAKLVTRCGFEVKNFRKMEEDDCFEECPIEEYPYCFELDGSDDVCTNDGRYYRSGEESRYDLFLADDDDQPEQPLEMVKSASAFRAITEQMAQTYERKNHDYGNSFDQSLDEFGEVAGVIRIGDKFNRLKKLTSTTAKVSDESIEDTLLDMANYAIMMVMWRRNNQ